MGVPRFFTSSHFLGVLMFWFFEKFGANLLLTTSWDGSSPSTLHRSPPEKCQPKPSFCHLQLYINFTSPSFLMDAWWNTHFSYGDLMITCSTLHLWPDTEPAVMAAAAGVPSWPVTFRPRSEVKLTKPRVTSPKPWKDFEGWRASRCAPYKVGRDPTK